MKAVLLPVGSFGDVHPFLGLGRALAARGNEVTVVTNGYFEVLVRRAGLGFVELGTAEEYEEMVRNPDLWHPRRGSRLIFSMVLGDGLRRMVDAVTPLFEPGRTAVVGSTLALGALIAAEKLAIPYATVHLQPAVMPSAWDPPVLPSCRKPSWIPPICMRVLFWLGDRLVLARFMGKPINALRRELGLPPLRKSYLDAFHSSRLVIGLFPHWFAPPPPDWPPQLRLTGFPLFDETELTPIDGAAVDFLDDGDPPIVFTPGSAMAHGHEFFEQSLRACHELGRRGIFLSRYDEHIPRDLPDTVRHFRFVPFSALLPRAALVVHHGGIGSVAQALAAGIPQLVMPMAHDQPDNAWRVRGLGVGDFLRRSEYAVPELSRRIARLLDSEEVAARSAALREKMDSQAALDESCRLIEALVD